MATGWFQDEKSWSLFFVLAGLGLLYLSPSRLKKPLLRVEANPRFVLSSQQLLGDGEHLQNFRQSPVCLVEYTDR